MYVLTAEDSSQHETVKAGCAEESDKNNFRICSLNYINKGIRGRDHNEKKKKNTYCG